MNRMVFQLFLKCNLNVPSSHVLSLQNKESGTDQCPLSLIGPFFHFSALMSSSVNRQYVLA